MGAGARQPSRVLDRIAYQVGTIAAIGTRIAQGKRRFTELESSLENVVKALTAESQGYFAFYMSERSSGNQTEVGTMTVTALLFASLPKDTTSDVNSLSDLLEDVLKQLSIESNFSNIGARPASVTYAESPDNFEDGISVWEFTAVYKIGAVSGA